MKKFLFAALLAVVVAGVWWLVAARRTPPEVRFARVRRETLVSAVRTNGKVAPLHWMAVRAARAGALAAVSVERGQTLSKGAVVAELAADGARADLEAAEALITQATADLEMYGQGGRQSELVAIDSSLKSARADLHVAQKQLEALSRLAGKEAATGEEVAAAREKVARAEIAIDALEKKRQAIVAPTDRKAAEARLRQALAAAEQARRRLSESIIRTGISGTAYNIAVRPGAYLQAGDLVAEVGQLDRVRVTIFVDEPELARVSPGLPVTIRWDGLPGRSWTGRIERAFSQIVKLETRQVGEVTGIIENPGQDLVPGANVDVEIRSRIADNVLTIPKETLRRQDGETGVFVLEGDRLSWRVIELGAASITNAEVTRGLKEGDRVALSADVALRPGDRVTPLFP